MKAKKSKAKKSKVKKSKAKKSTANPRMVSVLSSDDSSAESSSKVYIYKYI